jgi:hypothetical protein
MVTKTSSSNFFYIRRGVKTSGNKLESLCVRVCIMFKNFSKYVEGNHEGIYT